jgi:hypothetical protein
VALLLLTTWPVQALECGDVIATAAALDRDLVCTTDPALTLAGATLDLRGFTVSCDRTRVGVLIEGRGARLRHGAVTGCEVAIWLGGQGDHRVRQVTASASSQGVFVESDGNLLTASRVLRGLEDAAVQVDGSDNRLRFNDVAGSIDQGFEINGNDNRVVGNRIAGVAEGVQLAGDGNRVLGNQIIGTTDRGVEVRAGAHRIADNLIADGAADGIALFSDGNRVTANTILGHGDQGLFVSGLDNALVRNRVLLNRVDLTDTTPACDQNLWRDNTFESSESDDCVD